jgi:hypothetical protein
MNQISSIDPLGLEREELRSIRADILAVKATITNRRLALTDELPLGKKRTPFDFGVADD